MTEISELKRIQQMELEILKAFASFCEKHSLHYELMGGTLLGAIRHNGFIPWDDDIDVSMPRPDYEKFLEFTKTGFTDNYKVLSLKYTFDYIYPYVKIIDCRTIMFENGLKNKYNIGLYIDVFPIDGYPLEKKNIIKHFKTIKNNRGKLWRGACNIKQKDIFRTFYVFFKSFIYQVKGAQYYSLKIENESKRYLFGESEFVSPACSYGERGKMLKRDYLDVIKIKFCGEEFWCMKNFHEHLKNIYGDYLKLPPKEKRIANHNYRLFWIDKEI